MRRLGLAAALLTVGQPGCVTSGQGDKLRQDVDRLGARVAAMDRRDTEIKEQLARLQGALEQATAQLARNAAEVGAKMSQHEGDFAQVKGQLEALQRNAGSSEARVAALEQMQQKIVDRVAPSIPKDKEQLWREAQGRMSGGQRNDARRFLSAYIQRFPQDARAPQARILIGGSYSTEGNHANAVGEYMKVIDSYPEAPQVEEAMWLMAQAYVDMKLCSEARSLLMDFRKRFPDSRWAEDAKDKVRDLQRFANDKTRCSN